MGISAEGNGRSWPEKRHRSLRLETCKFVNTANKQGSGIFYRRVPKCREMMVKGVEKNLGHGSEVREMVECGSNL